MARFTYGSMSFIAARGCTADCSPLQEEITCSSKQTLLNLDLGGGSEVHTIPLCVFKTVVSLR